MSQLPVLWPIEPHTQAKHYILRYYLGAWLAIQSKEPKRLLYIDGFAGPGKYQGGEPGSPVVALQAALEPGLLRRLQRSELLFYFIEENLARYNNLNSEISNLKLPSNFKVQADNTTFESAMGDVLDELDKQRTTLAPSFVLIDPFGITGYPMHLIERIRQHPRSEVMINFNYQDLNRWFLQDPSKHVRLDQLYGDDRWRPALEIVNPRAREEFLLERYKDVLQEKGWRCLTFRMINTNNQTQYHLVYGTTHYLGMLAMKQAMWSASPEGTFTFSDLSNPYQPALFSGVLEEGYAQDLADQLFNHWKGRTVGKQSIIEQDLAWHPASVDRHLTRALRILEYESSPARIVRVEKADRSRRRARSYPENVRITFAP